MILRPMLTLVGEFALVAPVAVVVGEVVIAR